MKHLKRALLFCMALALVVSAVAAPLATTVHATGYTASQTISWSGNVSANSIHPFTSTPDLIQDLIEELRAQNITPAIKEQDEALVASVEDATNMTYETVKNTIATYLKDNLSDGTINVSDLGLDKNTMVQVLNEVLHENYLYNAVSDLSMVTQGGEVTKINFSVSQGFAAAMDAMNSEYAEVEVNADTQVAQDAAVSLISTPAVMAMTREVSCTNHTVAADFIGDFNADGEIDMFDLFVLRDMILDDETDWHQDFNEDGEVDMFDIFDLRDGILNDDLPTGEPIVNFTWAVTPDYSPVFRMDAEGNMLDADGNITEDPAQAIMNGGLLYNPEDKSISEGTLPNIYHKLTEVSFKCDVCGEDIVLMDDPETEEDELASLSMAQDIYINLNTYETVACNVGETPVLAEGETMEDYLHYTEMQIGTYTDDTFSIMINPETGEPVLDANGNYIPNMEMDEEGNPVLDENGNPKIIGLFTSDAQDNGAQEVAFYYAVLSAFNADHADYFGVSTDYWTSKNTEANPMAALKSLCNLDPNQDIPPAQMIQMVQMLPQAFMAYKHYYGAELLAMRDAAMEAVNALPGNASDIQKLLVIHDWLAENAVFDMGSMLNVSGTGGNNDPIQMTTFGALLSNQLTTIQNSSYYGGICLAYAAAYTYLVQAAYPEIYTTEVAITDENGEVTDYEDVWCTPAQVDAKGGDIVDFCQVMFYADTADTSIAGEGFGGGAFNNVHYFNAVRLDDAPQDPNAEDGDMEGNWFYVDSCYDDIYIECLAQYRAEAEGSVYHSYFLVSPQTMAKMWADNIDYIDSLYDGYVYVPQVDEYGQVITPSDNIEPDRDCYDPNHPEYEKVEAPDEDYNHNTCYEDSWFSGAVSKIYNDGKNWYYVDSGSNSSSYSSMMNDDGEIDIDMDQMLENGLNMESMMHSNRVGAANQNKMKFRPMTSPDYWVNEETDDSGNMLDTSNKEDTYATVLFDYGTGAVSGVEGISEELLAAVLEDFVYREQYPSLTHSIALNEGIIYFNLGNQIWTMEAEGSAPSLFKEYNTVSATSDGRPFKGSSYTMDAEGTDLVVENNPIAALCLRTAYQPLYNYLDADGNIVLDFQGNPSDLYMQKLQTGEMTQEQMQAAIVGRQFVMMYGNPTVTVNIGTNYSYTSAFEDTMTDDEKSASIYTVEAINYNPDYTQGISEDTVNDNSEFLWCANIREDIALADWAASTGATDNVPCAAQINGHSYVYNAEQDAYICSACNLHAVNIVGDVENGTVALTTITESGISEEFIGNIGSSSPDNSEEAEDTLETTTEVVHPEREAAITQSGEITITVTPDEGYGLPVVSYTTEGAEEAIEVDLTANADGTYTGSVTKEAEGCITFNVELKQVVDLTVTEVPQAEVTVLTTVSNITEAPVVEEDIPVEDETPDETTPPENETPSETTPPEDQPATAAEGDESTDGEGTTDGEDTPEVEVPVDPATLWSVSEGETKIVPMGDKLTIVVKPEEGYAVNSVEITTPGAEDATVTTSLPANETNKYSYEVTGGPITVTVKFDVIYDVILPETENGTVTADKAAAKAGETVTLTVAADDGYLPVADAFSVSYQVVGEPAEGETEPTVETVYVELTEGETAGTCTFVMPAADVTVSAEFTKIHTVSISTGIPENEGSVATETTTAVKGDTVTFSVIPAAGYEVESISLLVNGTTSDIEPEETDEGEYTFEMPDGDVVINASFKVIEVIPEPYVVTVEEAENGTVSASVEEAEAGTEIILTIEAADGFEVDTITVVAANEATVSVVDNKFIMPESNVTVTVTFKAVETPEENPEGGEPVDPENPEGGEPVDPENPEGGEPVDPENPEGGEPVDPENPEGGEPVDPENPEGGEPVDPENPEGGEPVDPENPEGGEPVDPENPEDNNPTTGGEG